VGLFGFSGLVISADGVGCKVRDHLQVALRTSSYLLPAAHKQLAQDTYLKYVSFGEWVNAWQWLKACGYMADERSNVQTRECV
jgi:hypothetical protein